MPLGGAAGSRVFLSGLTCPISRTWRLPLGLLGSALAWPPVSWHCSLSTLGDTDPVPVRVWGYEQQKQVLVN